MPPTTHQIYDEIKTYIQKKGEPYARWYVGITSNARERLFIEHGLSEKEDIWIYRNCQNNRAANNIKESLLKIGCDGAGGGWDDSTTTVYAYLKSPNTTP